MDIDALAALAANTVVAAAVTDAFEGLRARVARVFGRDKPDVGIQRRLDTTRQQLAATARGDLEGAKAAQARRWRRASPTCLPTTPRWQRSSRRCSRSSARCFLKPAGT